MAKVRGESSQPPAHLAHLAALPETIALESLPPRLRQMVVLLLAHEEVICRYAVGLVELHFHVETVRVRLGCNLSG